MDEAAPQAAGTGADTYALDELRHHWGDAYWIWWDKQGGWQALRRDDLGGKAITAGDPEGLWQAVKADYELKHVPRDLPGQEP
jgi:hypothetical protein